jgi:hypothetical protein
MALRYLFQAKAVLEARFQQFLFKNMFPAQLQLDYVGRLHNDHSADTNSSLLDSIWLAGPKSKVRAFSPIRVNARNSSVARRFPLAGKERNIAGSIR